MGVYFKKDISKHNLTEAQLREAFDIYEKKVIDDIFTDMKAECGIDVSEEDASTKPFLTMLVSKAIGKGMEIVTENQKVIDYYLKTKNLEAEVTCGVLDRTDNILYPCSTGTHWKKISEIIEQKYPQYHEAFNVMMYEEKGVNEYQGVTRKQLDDFILTTFQLEGEMMELNFYIDDAKDPY